MVLLTASLVMAALAGISALPAMAEQKSCDEVVAQLQEALNSRDINLKEIDEGEMLSLARENPQCLTSELLTPELVEQLRAAIDYADELIGPNEGSG
jgi:chromosome segregation and condensation protein ScpB